jgi:small subunit ribosomal protein S23
MEKEEMSKDQAYDQARKEFYKLRQREETEKRIAVEEARMVGAYFGKSLLRVGLELESKAYDRWKAWADEEIEKSKAQVAQTEIAAATLPDMVRVGEGEDASP